MTAVHTVPVGAAVEDFGYRPAPVGLRANMIFSADGAAAFAGRAGPLSCPQDHRLLLALRAYADVVLVGAGTARAERYRPVRLDEEHYRVRREMTLSQTPPPIAVVSRSGQLPETLFASPTPPILITSARGARDCAHSRDGGVTVMMAGDDDVDIPTAIKQLRDRGMVRVLCEGGPTLLDQLIECGLVDELCVTLAPRLAGHQPLGRGRPAALPTPQDMRLQQVVVSDNGYLFLRYRQDERNTDA